MNILKTSDLESLMAKREGVCVSIYMPTHKMGPGTQQDPIRLKNLLKKAEELMADYGMRNSVAKEFLKPAYDLIPDNLYWSYQDSGLALFVTDGFNAIHKLPLSFEELVTVSDRFHLKPLLPLLQEDGEFYLLALSQKSVRLFQGDRRTMNEVELEGVVKSIDETLKYDVLQKQLTMHGSGPGPSGKREGAVFHGHGASEDPKEEVLRFMRDVDRGLKPLLSNNKAPLVLACVEYLFPIYKEANTFPNLLDNWVSGNPNGFSSGELHQEAWKTVEPAFSKSQEDAAAKYYDLAGTGRTSKDLRKVLDTAIAGRVDTLFVALGVQSWGYYNSEANTVELHAEREPGDEDLLDLAAIQTFLHGGTVFAVEPDKVPDDRHLAAILRY